MLCFLIFIALSNTWNEVFAAIEQCKNVHKKVFLSGIKKGYPSLATEDWLSFGNTDRPRATSSLLSLQQYVAS